MEAKFRTLLTQNQEEKRAQQTTESIRDKYEQEIPVEHRDFAVNEIKHLQDNKPKRVKKLTHNDVKAISK